MEKFQQNGVFKEPYTPKSGILLKTVFGNLQMRRNRLLLCVMIVDTLSVYKKQNRNSYDL